MSHECPREGCTRRVSDDMLACPRHWYVVTSATRRRVWAAFRGPGIGSNEHTEAITQAISEMNAAKP